VVDRTEFPHGTSEQFIASEAIKKQMNKANGVKRVRTAMMLNKVFIDYDESETNTSQISKAIGASGHSRRVVRNEVR
jgi:copper chaperone CopZ